MRILLRNAKTELYLNKSGDWTPDPHRARVFSHGAEAVHIAYKLEVDQPELVMQFEDPAHWFSVTLGEEATEASARFTA